VGIALDDVYLATVLKCRPPGNRDPLPEEVAACEPHLFRQLELVRPRVVASLGSFATAFLSGRALGITRIHGQEQRVTLGGWSAILYPLYHPAAALYTPSMLDVLERDVARLPALLSHEPVPAVVAAQAATPAAEPDDEPRIRQPVQLGLF
jgi:DNA polymerase